MQFLYEFTQITFMALGIILAFSLSIGILIIMVDLTKPFIMKPYYKKAYLRNMEVIRQMDDVIGKYRNSEVVQDTAFNRVIYRDHEIVECFKVDNIEMIRVYKARS